MTTAVNIEIPPGSVGALHASAANYQSLADTLDTHRQTLVTTSYTLAGQWSGGAADSYHEYSEHVIGSYAKAASQAGDVASRIRAWANSLQDDQAQSRRLISQATQIASEIDTTTATLDGQLRTPAGSHAAVQTERRLTELRQELTDLETQARKVYDHAASVAHAHAAYVSAVHVVAPAPLPTPVASVCAVAASGAAVMSGGSVTIPPVVSGPVPKRIAAMIRQADALLGLPYVWGGGHSGWGPQQGYDCSGFVSKVLHAAGLLDSPQTTQGLPGQPGIANGPGHYVTIYDRTDAGSGNDHVIIDINGQFYESGGEAGAWGGGGGVEKINPPSAAYLASFNQMLHPVGF